jgi:hypothetical protein
MSEKVKFPDDKLRHFPFDCPEFQSPTYVTAVTSGLGGEYRYRTRLHKRLKFHALANRAARRQNILRRTAVVSFWPT